MWVLMKNRVGGRKGGLEELGRLIGEVGSLAEGFGEVGGCEVA